MKIGVGLVLWLSVSGLAWAQTQAAPIEASAGNEQCAELAKRGPDYVSLVKTCEFALSYRRSLPNFVCEQIVENSGWPPPAPPVVIHAKVRYEDGRDSYTDLLVNGKPTDQESLNSKGGVSLMTTGDFGSQLIDLFRAPLTVDFKLQAQPTAGVVVYEFEVTAKKNKFWPIRDTKQTIYPEYEGELTVDAVSGRPVRMVGRWVHLPKSFDLTSAEIETHFEDVTVSEVGTFLLPAYSKANACVRGRKKLSLTGKKSDDCIHNVMSFSDCHKFASKSRIFMSTPQ